MEATLPEESQTALPEEGIDPAFRGALDVAVSLYRQMVRLRLVSARMVELQRAEKIAFHSACIGEEAVIAAAALAARPSDWLFPGVREWGVAVIRGMPLASYAHHVFGSSEDPARGHAAPDHPPARRFNVAPASGVVGAHVLQAVGAAWAAKIKKESVATVALFGAEAMSTGDLHNALNFAGVFKAPCVFVCRSHGGAVATRDTAVSAADANRGLAYGVATARVDGSDALGVVTVVRAALARAAEGKGATLVEAVTRPLAPSLAPGDWLGADVLGAGAGDPVARLRRVLERERLLDADGAEAVAREARAEIEAAVAAAERAAPPARGTIFENVYAEVPPHLRAQQKESSR